MWNSSLQKMYTWGVPLTIIFFIADFLEEVERVNTN